MKSTYSSMVKKIVGVVAVLVFIGLSVTQAGLLTRYSNDKDNLRFGVDTLDEYVEGEAMPVELSLVEVSSGEKPQGVSMLMSVNDGSPVTIFSSDSTNTSRFYDLSSFFLQAGTHKLTFTSPQACGNYFDYSEFDFSIKSDSETRFDHTYTCSFDKLITVRDNTVTTGPSCQDPAAINLGDPLPCIFDSNSCTNPAALNYGGPLPCEFPAETCTDVDAENFGGSLPCTYTPYVYGCTDSIALNYNLNADADDGSCQYDPNISPSNFLCSINNQPGSFVECEGRTFTLRSRDEPIYVRTDVVSAGVWSDWCTGDIHNGVDATFVPVSGNRENAQVTFSFPQTGTFFNQVLCLNPDSPSWSQIHKNIKIKLADATFIEQ